MRRLRYLMVRRNFITGSPVNRLQRLMARRYLKHATSAAWSCGREVESDMSIGSFPLSDDVSVLVDPRSLSSSS